jgi:glucose/arabinose dehydrogenase/HEAT repeat protein
MSRCRCVRATCFLNFAAILSLVTFVSCARKNPSSLSPEESLARFQVEGDFHMELVASEPLVFHPVAMVFDEDGKIYVSEMLDGPGDPPGPAHSRIVLLQDTDGDGKPDKRTIFADGLAGASGIMPWKGGLIVANGADIVYLKDTDGDGKADVRQVLYTGFAKGNPKARITNPQYGIDNWIYVANDGTNGRITSPEHSERPLVTVRGTDFRFQPLRGLAEPASGTTQSGMSFDDWGNRFLSDNTGHVREAVAPMHYLMRAPHLEVDEVSQDVSEHGNSTAMGATVYDGDVFPKEYWGNIFTSDVGANLVHRDILTPDAVTFAAHPAEVNKEFLASADIWFRPCSFANAPDGNLYLTDLHGADTGRIYRIVPNHPLRARDLKPNLGKATTAELVAELADTNGWQRMTAQRLLVERQDRAAVPLLRELAQKSEFALARMHALWTLEGLSALEPQIVVAGLKDPHPGVREHALRLAEEFLGEPPVINAALALRNDPPRVLYQLAFTLGETKDSRALVALTELARDHAGEPWFRVAILSSLSETASDFFHLYLSRNQFQLNPVFLEQLAALIGAKHDANEMRRFLTVEDVLLPQHPNEGAAGLFGLARGLQLAGVHDLAVGGAEGRLADFLNQPSPSVQKASWEIAEHLQLNGLVQRASRDAVTAGLSLPNRAAAVRALRGGQLPAVKPILEQILASSPPPALQEAAVTCLGSFNDPSVATSLISNWKSYSPDARKQVIVALLSHRERVPALLQAIEDGQVEPSAVDLTARSRLRDDPDTAIALRARKLF